MFAPKSMGPDPSQKDRRAIADWAANCAERVLPIFETERPDDPRPRLAIARARAFAHGDLTTADGIRQRFGGGSMTDVAISPAASAAASSAGQASAVCHMGAHGLGAAAYAITAASLSNMDHQEAGLDEMRWQLATIPPSVKAALQTLPTVGTDRSGPLGFGLLSSGEIGRIIRDVQSEIRH